MVIIVLVLQVSKQYSKCKLPRKQRKTMTALDGQYQQKSIRCGLKMNTGSDK